MRITSQIPLFDSTNLSTSLQKNAQVDQETIKDYKEEQNPISKLSIQKVLDKLNEFMEVHNSNLKFVYHEGLKEYYVKVVDSWTDEVVREIPPKELLDAYYEMQKIIGNIVDEKV